MADILTYVVNLTCGWCSRGRCSVELPIPAYRRASWLRGERPWSGPHHLWWDRSWADWRPRQPPPYAGFAEPRCGPHRRRRSPAFDDAIYKQHSWSRRWQDSKTKQKYSTDHKGTMGIRCWAALSYHIGLKGQGKQWVTHKSVHRSFFYCFQYVHNNNSSRYILFCLARVVQNRVQHDNW